MTICVCGLCICRKSFTLSASAEFGSSMRAIEESNKTTFCNAFPNIHSKTPNVMFNIPPAAIFDLVGPMDGHSYAVSLHVLDMFHIFHRFMYTRLDIWARQTSCPKPGSTCAACGSMDVYVRAETFKR